MAKFLLWAFVVGNFAMHHVNYKQGIATDKTTFFTIWIAIGVIAVCDAIKASKGSDKR